MALHTSSQNYLKTIYILQKEKGTVRSVDVAQYMGVSKPSVSRAVKILQDGGLLRMDDDYRLRLTEEGREIAENLYERYQYFVKHLVSVGVDTATAEEEACKMEHTISENSFKLLKERKQTGCSFADSCRLMTKDAKKT